MKRDVQYRFKDLDSGGFSPWYDANFRTEVTPHVSQEAVVRAAFRDEKVTEVTMTYDDGSSVTYAVKP